MVNDECPPVPKRYGRAGLIVNAKKFKNQNLKFKAKNFWKMHSQKMKRLFIDFILI